MLNLHLDLVICIWRTEKQLNVSLSIPITPWHNRTDFRLFKASQKLTDTSVVVAGQLVSYVTVTVVRSLRVHADVHAVVGQTALISVCKVTQTWVIRQVTKQAYTKLYYHVTNRCSGLHFSGSLEGSGRCRSLWCCNTSVRGHKRVVLLYIRLCLQWTHRNIERRTPQLDSCPS